MDLPGTTKIEFKDRESWLKFRGMGIGSSDAAGVLGASQFSSPLKVWEEKMGLAPPREDTRFTKAGRFLEPAVVAWFEEETGLTCVDPGPFTIYQRSEVRSTGEAVVMCTPDRLIEPPKGALLELVCGGDRGLMEFIGVPGGPGVLEIKTAGSWKAEEWGKEPPLAYQIQVQHQLFVTGLNWAIICVLIGGNDLRWFLVTQNLNFQAKMVTKIGEFWRYFVQAKKAPPSSGPDDLDVMQRLSKNDGLVAEGNLKAWECAKRWKKAIRLRGKIVGREDSLKHEIMKAMQEAEAETLVFPDGSSVSLLTTSTSGYTVKPSTYKRLVLRQKKESK